MKVVRDAYKHLRKLLPRQMRGALSKAVFSFSGKPFVMAGATLHGRLFPETATAKGGMIVSADFEMAWAFRYSKKVKNCLEKARLERKNFPFILETLEKYSIPVTWATVGHLFLRGCKAGAHDWMHRIPHFNNGKWIYEKGDWFDHDPYQQNWTDAPEWYAPDLIESILKSRVKHDIGLHSFSHIDCSNRYCPPQVLEDELIASLEAMKLFGIERPLSFVFPGGTAGNYEILKKRGICIYRKNMFYDLAYPFFDDFGMLVSPTTLSFGDNQFGWSADYFISRFKKSIDKAIRTNTVCHFWFHPSVDEWTLKNVMPGVLEYAAEKREMGALWVGTMAGIAEHVLKNK
jgi:peptidoglycan/xylan/chitin deacetylase (PgdA/CDA1 family)